MKLVAIVQTEWFGQRVEQHVQRGRRRFLFAAGFAVRQRARRSLRPARRKRDGELTEREAQQLRAEMIRYKMGLRSDKPKPPEIIAGPGEVPRLHTKPKSPLKDALLFALSPKGDNAVVGPSRTKSVLSRLERSNPFMAPALESVRPEFSRLLTKAFSK